MVETSEHRQQNSHACVTRSLFKIQLPQTCDHFLRVGTNVYRRSNAATCLGSKVHPGKQSALWLGAIFQTDGVVVDVDSQNRTKFRLFIYLLAHQMSIVLGLHVAVGSRAENKHRRPQFCLEGLEI